jgi:hypothetical protein
VFDHVIARQHHGRTAADNLALCCVDCNRHKGPNLSGFDSVTEKITPLFNPRCDAWPAHFRWSGATLVGRTAVGRVTVDVLSINLPRRVAARAALMRAGTF